MTYTVTLTHEALEDLLRLEDFLVESALQYGDFDLPRRAIQAIRAEVRVLETNPFTCRIADADRLERELVIPFGASGYVALFRIIDDQSVVVAAIRHQREDDCH
ncbi:type II toxin-antitoxin system RelE/ParE family toxin [Variovorax sp. J22R133]|uniref:type II toxin-antitoxin system RelE/ParE family toxin n=1 Tax=Variovorax brevis TaxID=3053503 RepID=UPI0025763384|nr:type II toxin-antitoxin system RelE/ParE family toxin [Variovorax sp. J22R133]MDM0116395.1 type II toxin-antitoxin system RelE/ParE family toxin [Variovorax sp. J22R133]